MGMFQCTDGNQSGTSRSCDYSQHDAECDAEIARITKNCNTSFLESSNSVIKRICINCEKTTYETTEDKKKYNDIVDCETIDNSILRILRHVNHSKSCKNNDCLKHHCFGLKILYEH